MIFNRASGLHSVLEMALAAALVLTPTARAQQRDAERQETERKAQASKPQSKLVLGKAALSREHVINFPMQFTAAPGETVGKIHAQVSLPEGGWKFVKVEPSSGSRLKVSAKQAKGGGGQGSQSVLDLTISAGTHVIRDGVIGTLQLSAPPQQSVSTELPVARVLSTAPPETEEVSVPSQAPVEMPPEPPANPGVACFFFSH